MRVGIVGLGRMGAAIAGRLVDLGHELVVWNRSPAAAEPLAEKGVAVARSPADLAARSDIVVTSLRDADALDNVFNGPHGLLSAQLSGQLIVETSTVRPHVQQSMAAAVRAQGGHYLECALGGSVGPAKEGQLLGLAGGRAEDLDRARPVLSQLCRRLELVGDVGAGASMKLAINLPLLTYYEVLAEAMALCGHLRLDPEWVLQLLSESSGGANMLKRRAPAIADGLKGHNPTPVTFDVDTVRKDLRTMIGEADGLGFDLPLTLAALRIYDDASREGWGARDCTTLTAYGLQRNETEAPSQRGGGQTTAAQAD